jgi:hypothetical protein
MPSRRCRAARCGSWCGLSSNEPTI